MSNTGIIIQARTTSERFPNKIFKEFNGIPILDHVINRADSSGFKTVLAIPDTQANDILEMFLNDRKLDFVRGSESNVTERILQAAVKFDIDPIIRVCGDSPLIRPEDIRLHYDRFVREGRTRMVYGDGCWVFTRKMLRDVDEGAVYQIDREHCGFHYMNKSIDYPEDIERLQKELANT